MKPICAPVLLVLGLCGCATTDRLAAPEGPDPGRLASARQVVNVPGLRPCSDGAEQALHLDPRQKVNVLVHGCNGSTGRFRALAEVLAFHGQQSACFTYDARASLMASSGRLAHALGTLAQGLETPAITVIGHSVGGLIARKALVQERPDAIGAARIDLELVTVSAPFAGIAAAQACAFPVLRLASLGINDFLCWTISGDSWHEITYASSFIRQPGSLAPQVRRHLKVVTDERDTCRRRDEDGQCVEGDYIFSLAEQRYPPVARTPGIKEVEVSAGHVEIVGQAGVTPRKLIAVLQREGVVHATPPERQSAFGDLLAQLYGN